MKVFAVPRFGAVEPRPPFRTTVRAQLRHVVEHVIALNGRIDEARARRDRVNQQSGTVDSAFWIFLR
jgi:hypothetical protein